MCLYQMESSLFRCLTFSIQVSMSLSVKEVNILCLALEKDIITHNLKANKETRK